MRPNLSLNVHKITLFIAALHVFYVENQAALPISPRVSGYILLGFTLAGLLVKTFQEPPKKPEAPAPKAEAEQ